MTTRQPKQSSLFDLLSAEQLKESGIDRVSSNNQRFLNEARNVAAHIARDKGQVTADDVVNHYGGVPAYVHQNAVGAIFNDSRFVATGEYVHSTRKSNHHRRIAIWRLKHND